jgi:hypothetical protein
MAFNAQLADRIRKILDPQPDLVEKKMFGGVGFLLNGNMACGVHGDNLIIRLDPEETGQALSKPHTHVFDLTGRPMRGWILVQPEGVTTKAALSKWVQVGVKYASSLPAK